MTPLQRIDRVAAGLWRAQVPMDAITANCYLLADGGEGLLIDTAATEQADADHIPALLAAAGVAPPGLRGVLITHAHRDHVGHAAAVQRELGVPVLIHPAEKHTLDGLATWCGLSRDGLTGWLERRGVPGHRAAAIAATFAPEPGPPPAVIRHVADGEELAVGSMRWRVLFTPGHTSGHICLYEPRRRLLLTGDHLLPPGGGNAHVTVRPGSPPDPLAAYHESVRRVASLDVTLALPGHGDPVADVAALATRHLARHRRKLEETRAGLAAGPLTPYALALRLGWGRGTLHDLPGKLQFLALGEVLARLARLRCAGAVRRTAGDGVAVYALAD
ncbi:glyoxylase-like metal-dependent hydrolase (beta-lactamase superfamily II) [Thermocatellispora tengchongensis]|uniref:Glyoxylase-like metal-dependent hydrolase (Beta-lactamase superfamily II) n=2 Tax=Thermocatellispora tengchongensis TaxID=1073253 RepID=A0A840PC49_9ACTN|nr:MBL fold metallo-hydrolase [Thermocatellispora tengchongensis]MBB5136822.1 glyoxylase-like metal-dependent hydrolase (beta-lactamase superfamily II) [Thermocatellispora tengchongensis]